jgi:hypothetical protein
MITETDIQFISLFDQVSNTRYSDSGTLEFYQMIRETELSEVCQVVFVSRYIPHIVFLYNPCPAVIDLFNRYIQRDFPSWLSELVNMESSYDHYNLVANLIDTFSNDAFKLLTDQTKELITSTIRGNFQQNAYDIGHAVQRNYGGRVFGGPEVTTEEMTKNILSLLTDEEAVKFVLYGSTR